MSTNRISSVSELIAQLRTWHRQKWSGSLEVIASPQISLSWRIFLREGTLTWVAGGPDPTWRWSQIILNFVPQLNSGSLSQSWIWFSQYREYLILAQLHQQGSLTTTDAAQLQKTVLVERFFDLFQYLKINPFQYIETNQIVSESDWLPHRRPQLGLSGLPPNEVYFPAWILWQKWVKSGLKRVFPDYFLVVTRSPIIFSQAAVTKSTLPASAIQKLLTDYADGTRTLRQISAQSEQDLLTLTRALMPLLTAGGLSLSPIPRLRKLRKLSGGADNFNTPEASFVYPGSSI